MIRRAVKADIPKILEIENVSFSDPWEERSFNQVLDQENKYFFVEEIDSKLAGYVVFETVFDEGHITNLAVAKPFQRKGVASRFLEKMIDLARSLKIKDIFLEVRESNKAAAQLYSKFGFREVGKRKGYYPKANEDALILKLSLIY